MPALQVVNTTRDKPEPTQVEKLFSQYQNYAKERKEGEEVGKLAAQYKEALKTGADLRNTRADIMSNMEIGPTKRLELIKMVDEGEKQANENIQAKQKAYKDAYDMQQEQIKKQAEADKERKTQEESKALLLKNGVDEDEATRLSKVLSPTSAKIYGKVSDNISKEEQAFKNSMATSGAKEAQELDKVIAKQSDMLQNIGTVEKLMNEQLGGIQGYAKGIVNTESASQVRTLGASNLDGIIKLFNPAGTLPTAKLNWIRSTFSVSPLDNLSEAQGKINTQRILATQAIERAKKRSALLKQYFGNVPSDVLKEFDKETSDMITAIQEEVDPKSLENKTMKEKPSAAENAGRTIKDQNGKKFKSNGKEWVPV